MRQGPISAAVRPFLLAALLAACGSSSSAPPLDDAGARDGGTRDAGAHDTGRDVARHEASASEEAGKPDVATKDAEAGPPGTPGSPELLGEDCDPMVPDECGYPFPSSVWTATDTAMPTGVHVAFGKTTLPESSMGVRIGTAPFATRDGFSPGAAILTYLPNATVTGLPALDTIASSVEASSKTLLIEADTGELVPHFAELDVSTNDPQSAFMIHPAIRLKDATRYIVAIRGVVDASGKALPANEAFAALRDDAPSSEISIGRRRALYADIMQRLTKAGVDKASLQAAWDFTTASKENTTKWLVSMRDKALATVGSEGPTYTITKVEENPNTWIRRRLTGMMEVPLYLTSATSPANITFGADGLPTQHGTAKFEFLVHIPNSLVTSGKPGPIIENGHGLLGSEAEGQNGYLAQICDREGYVAVAVNLVGMASDDQDAIIKDVGGDLSGFEQQVERQHQGLVNELLAVRMMMGRMATDPETIFNGKPTIDPTTRFWRGDSQGGILGATFMTIATDVTRGFLGEPGAPYALLLNRSADFAQFLVILRIAYPRALDVELDIDLIDELWDRTEPDGYLPYLRANTLPNTPAHEVLLAAALGDHQVTPLGAEFMARTLGANALLKVNDDIFGIPDTASGFTGSGFVLWSFGLPPAPVTDVPMQTGTDPHDELPSVLASEDMVDTFLRTGVVKQTCPHEGPCVAVCGDAGTCVAE